MFHKTKFLETMLENINTAIKIKRLIIFKLFNSCIIYLIIKKYFIKSSSIAK